MPPAAHPPGLLTHPSTRPPAGRLQHTAVVASIESCGDAIYLWHNGASDVGVRIEVGTIKNCRRGVVYAGAVKATPAASKIM